MPKILSRGEEEFSLHCEIYKLNPVREYIFYPSRKWRFDFAFMDDKIAVEIEGGTWSNGRHTRGSGFEKDLEKYNKATLLGWRVFRFTPSQVASGQAIDMIVLAHSTSQSTI